MSTSTTSSTPQSAFAGLSLDPQLLNLYSSLHKLPESLPDHPEAYPFAEKFVLDQHDVEFYGSNQAALNHRLELVFGSQSPDGCVRFRGGGRSLEAIVYILNKYIDGNNGDNLLLWKWVDDLTRGATQMSSTPTNGVS
ncbi:hypothetical protein FRC11_013491, partial [Ceratobasidium sp. 423]